MSENDVSNNEIAGFRDVPRFASHISVRSLLDSRNSRWGCMFC